MRQHYSAAGRVAVSARLFIGRLRSMGKPKVFCIGQNKTGTTSLARALRELGFMVGDQRLGELLLHDWARRDFRRLFRYCCSAEAFQDIPFSLPFTFQALDSRFRNSRFILTVRDNPEQWYNSLCRFLAVKFGQGRLPTIIDLKNAGYVYPGYACEANRLVHTTPEEDPYNKEMLIAKYNAHNAAVLEYFRHRPGDLLVLNVSEDGAYDRLCRFLDRPVTGRTFPWENRTPDIEQKQGPHGG